MTGKVVDYSSCDSRYRSYEQHRDEYSPHIADTLRSLKVEIRSWKADNDMVIQSQERLSREKENQVEVNAVIL